MSAKTVPIIDRVKSIANSLRSKELQVDEPQPLAECDHVFQLRIKVDSRVLPLVVAVNGIKEFNFTKHCIEDHTVKLMLLEGKIDDQEVSKYSEAKQVVAEDEIIDIIGEAAEENVRSVFNHIVCLLNYLVRKNGDC